MARLFTHKISTSAVHIVWASIMIVAVVILLAAWTTSPSPSSTYQGGADAPQTVSRSNNLIMPQRRDAMPFSVGGQHSQPAGQLALLEAVHMQLLAEISTKRERLRLLERRKKEIARLFARKEELLNREKERAADESAPEIPPGENRNLTPANVATAAAPLPRHSHTAAAAVTKAPPESTRKQIEEIKSMLRLAIKRRSASGAQLAESLASLSAETFTIAERQQKLEREVDDLRHLSAKLTKRLHAQGLTAGETAQPAVSENESAEGTAGSEDDLMGQLHHWLGKLQALRDKHPHGASEDHTGEDLQKILSAVGAGESAPAAGGGSSKKDNVGTEASVPTSKSSNAANGDARPSAKGSHHSAAGGAAADGGGDRLQEKADDLISQLKKGVSGSGGAKDGNGEGGGDDLASMADSFRDDSESDDLGGLGMVMASMQGVKGETMSDEQKRNFVATLGAALSS